LGKNRQEVAEVTRMVTPLLPHHKPRHLLGIGDEQSFLECIRAGIDTFDSCYPGRIGRHGTLLTRAGPRINLSKASMRDQHTPIDPNCRCFTCSNYTVAYLHHLHKAAEATAAMLGSIHNLHTIMELMKDYRRKVLCGEL
jgi:queuine tRNA-ribosyltransferase